MQNWDMWGGSKSKPSMEVEAATYADERIGPKILTQPADLDIYEKQNAEFSISADLAEGTTSGELSYQWYQVNRSGYRATLADGEGISGTLTDTLTLSGVTADMSGNTYYCEVTQYIQGKRATIGSSRALLTVNSVQLSVELVLTDQSGDLLTAPYGMYTDTVLVHAKLSWPQGFPAPTGDISLESFVGTSSSPNMTQTLAIGEQSGTDAGEYTGACFSWFTANAAPWWLQASALGDEIYTKASSEKTQYYVLYPQITHYIIFDGIPETLHYGDTVDFRAYIVEINNGETSYDSAVDYISYNRSEYRDYVSFSRKSGDVWTLTVTRPYPNGYLSLFASVSVDGTNVLGTSYFNAVARSVTVTAEDKRIEIGEAMPEYTAALTGAEGALADEIRSGLEITSAANADVPGRYVIKPAVKTNFEKADCYDMTLVPGYVTVDGVYYPVTYSAGANGSLSMRSSSTAFGVRTFAEGENILKTSALTFTAAPDTNFVVSEWIVDGQTVTNEDGSRYTDLNYIVSSHEADLDVRVRFVRARYPVSFGVNGGNGSLSAAAGVTEIVNGNLYTAATALTFTAIPDEGYIVDSWWLNGVQVSGEFDTTFAITLQGSTDVRVSFRPVERFTLSHEISGTGYGTVAVTLADGSPLNPANDTLLYGTSVIAVLTPYAGSMVNSWTVNGSVAAGADTVQLSLTVTENTHIVIDMDSADGEQIRHINAATVTVDTGTFIYNGEQHTPGVAVSMNGNTLIKDTDYTVSYGENVNAGLGNILITAKEPYAGEKTVTFAIEKAGGAAVDAPAAASRTRNSVTLSPVSVPREQQSAEYAVSAMPDAPADGWQTDLTFTSLDEYTRYYFFARAAATDNYNAGAASFGAEIYTADETAPTATVQYRTNGWRAFLNVVTFGLFFKDTADIEILGADEDCATGNSGVAKVEYYRATTPVSDPESITGWVTGTRFSVTGREKFHLYARVTDNDGNLSQAYFDSVVIFNESAAVTESISHTKFSGDKTASVTLNGNTVEKIVYGADTLTEGTDYTVSEEETTTAVTFAGSYLDSFAASGTTYTLTVYCHPMGEGYVSAPGNDPQPVTHIALTVNKAEQTGFIVIPPSEKVYGGADFNLFTSGGQGDGAVTFTVPADNGVLAVTADGAASIIGAGSVTVTATKAGDTVYNEAVVTREIMVERKGMDIPEAEAGLVYNGAEQTGVRAAEGYTVTDGTAVNAGTYTATVTPDRNHRWNSGDDRTAARTVAFTIARRAISVTAENQEKYAGAADPTLTYIISPALLSEDTLTGSLAYTGSAVGTYDILQGSLAHPNYEITFVKGIMTIRPTPAMDEVIDRINGIPDPVETLEDADEIADAQNAFDALTQQERGDFPGSAKDKLQKAQGQAALINHSSDGITISGDSLLWSVRIILTPVPESEARHTAFLSKLDGKKLLALYDIKLLNTLTGDEYTLPAGEVITVEVENMTLTGEKDIAVAHMKQDGSIEIIPAAVSGSKVTFEASSFSLYGIIAAADAKTPADPGKPTDLARHPSTGDSSNLMLWVLLSGAAVILLCGRFIAQRKRKGTAR